jgi:hypothetical protein
MKFVRWVGVILASIMFTLSSSAIAFEEYGLKAGDPKRKVLDALKGDGYCLENLGASEGFSFYTFGKGKNCDYGTIVFCSEKLSMFSYELYGGFEEFVSTITDFDEKYGYGEAFSHNGEVSNKRSRSMGVKWSVGKSILQVMFTHTVGKNNSFSVSWDAEKHVCEDS